MNLKPIEQKHREQVVAIYNYYIENSFAAYLETSVPLHFFDQLMRMCEGYPSVVAEDAEGNVLGFGLLRPYHAFPAFARTAFITYFIKPEFRGRGIGTQILECLVKQGREKGITTILADISSLNVQSINFHRKSGFVECGRLEGVGMKNDKVFDVVYMQKKLEHKRSRALVPNNYLEDIEKAYDTIAKEYAETFSGDHEKKPKDGEMLRKFAREIGDRWPVWDFGCGPGQTAGYLKGLGVEVSGLDLSEKMLEEARALHPDTHFRRGNLLDLEFEDGSIAGVTAFYAMVHLTEDQVGRAFREIFRVLQPGGVFLFTYHIGEGSLHIGEFLGKKIDIDFMLFTTDFILGCLRKSGFEEIAISEREPYSGLEYQSRRAYVFARKPDVRK